MEPIQQTWLWSTYLSFLSTYSFPLDDPLDFNVLPFIFDGLKLRNPFMLLDLVGGFWLGELGDRRFRLILLEDLSVILFRLDWLTDLTTIFLKLFYRLCTHVTNFFKSHFTDFQYTFFHLFKRKTIDFRAICLVNELQVVKGVK